jgi:hypothetical protein
MWSHRVPEKNDAVDLTLDDHGSQLLVASERSGFQLQDLAERTIISNLFLKSVFDHFPSGTSAYKPMLQDGLIIPFHPLNEILLSVVMGDQRYVFHFFHRVSCLSCPIRKGTIGEISDLKLGLISYLSSSPAEN